jgi:hypothetical protein
MSTISNHSFKCHTVNHCQFPSRVLLKPLSPTSNPTISSQQRYPHSPSSHSHIPPTLTAAQNSYNSILTTPPAKPSSAALTVHPSAPKRRASKPMTHKAGPCLALPGPGCDGPTRLPWESAQSGVSGVMRLLRDGIAGLGRGRQRLCEGSDGDGRAVWGSRVFCMMCV